MKTLYGFFKLQEEMGELNQVMGKLGPFPSGNHPDGAKDLYDRLLEELADVDAAIRYLLEANHLIDDPKVDHAYFKRRTDKIKLFRKWGLIGIDSEDQL